MFPVVEIAICFDGFLVQMIPDVSKFVWNMIPESIRILEIWTLEALGQTFLGHALEPLQFPQECLLPEVSRVAFTNYQCGETQDFLINGLPSGKLT